MLLKEFLSVLTEREDIISIRLSDYSTGEVPEKYSISCEDVDEVLPRFSERTVFDIRVEALGYASAALYISVH